MFKSFIAAIAVVLFALVSSSALAFDLESAGNCYTQQYSLGSATKFTGVVENIPGIPSVPRGDFGSAKGLDNAGAVSCGISIYNACMARPETLGQCALKVIGYADDNEYRSVHPAHNGGLGSQRAGIVGNPLRQQLGDKGVTAVEIEGASQTGNDGQRYVHIRAYIKTALPLAPHEVSAPPPPPKTACNDGIDNDADELIDLDDPGCYDSTDNTEWNPETDPDKLWKGMILPVLAAAANPCASVVVGWWDRIDLKFHYRVEGGVCECSTGDVDPKRPGFQVRSPNGLAKKAATDFNVTVEARAEGAVTWIQVRRMIEAPQRASTVEYVDDAGVLDASVSFGRAAQITDRGDMLIVSFPDLCEESLRLARQAEYGTITWFASGLLYFGFVNAPDGSPFRLASGADLTGLGQFGALFGNHRAALILALGAGVSRDPNCLLPATFDWSGAVGLRAFRSSPVGLAVDLRYVGSLGPYNGNLATGKHRGQFGIGPAIHPKGESRSITITPSFQVGTDVVSATTGGDVYTYTTRPWMGFGLELSHSF